VEPFTLPRFQVTLKASEPWYSVGDTPTIHGSVRYRSGAPVADAAVLLKIQSTNDWPPPTPWMEEIKTRTNKEGEFTLSLTPVPNDLLQQATLTALATVTDAAGERITGSGPIILSADPIVASVETELLDGLVPDFNNRIYVRVTKPDGTPLPGSTVKVTRAWTRRTPASRPWQTKTRWPPSRSTPASLFPSSFPPRRFAPFRSPRSVA